jgi:hypothetical protein
LPKPPQIERLNREILAWPADHPARRFLEAFIACRRDCVGRELTSNDSDTKPIDQAWESSTDGTRWTFSRFAYTFLSFDIVLEGWLSQAPTLTESEKANLAQLPLLTRLMAECRAAALSSGNTEIVALTKRVLETLNLWERCTRRISPQ